VTWGPNWGGEWSKEKILASLASRVNVRKGPHSAGRNQRVIVIDGPVEKKGRSLVLMGGDQLGEKGPKKDGGGSRQATQPPEKKGFQEKKPGIGGRGWKKDPTECQDL